VAKYNQLTRMPFKGLTAFTLQSMVCQINMPLTVSLAFSRRFSKLL